MIRRPPRSTLFPTRRSSDLDGFADVHPWPELGDAPLDEQLALLAQGKMTPLTKASLKQAAWDGGARKRGVSLLDRKSTRLNSSHSQISYAVFCLKKKTRSKY